MKNTIDNFNYYFIQIVSDVEELCEKWNETRIQTTANLVSGDIIDFRNERFNAELITDLKAKEFIVKKRIFLSDSKFEEVGGVFLLYIEPILN
ncbi:hypothetical protein [Chryseobacterium aureum]|uniref:hypothetical protein n=1 Tax=Chryseobacterium aureum TaxID=2497456 RepID=UPI000F892932|nr:hypothetical protein [Chryseobacterium aureum]